MLKDDCQCPVSLLTSKRCYFSSQEALVPNLKNLGAHKEL